MASISTESHGTRRIQFAGGDGRRRTLRLGKATLKQAQTVRLRVEQLVTASLLGHPLDEETSRWLAGIDDALHARLAAVGLVKPRAGERATVGAFVDAFIAGRPDVKPHTRLNLKQVRRWLVNYFGENRDLRAITPGDAEDWRAFMLNEGLGENTIRRHVGRARQIFKSAIRRGLVRGANPFEGLAATVRADKARQFFVTTEVTKKVIDACPDAQWKLMVALSRYGGLRCPSEHLSLKWTDVDWERNRVRVPSPKTEHHEGKDSRMIPLFPELRPYLLDVFEQAAEGSEYVITRYRERYGNLRTHFMRIIRKAGEQPWPKPWHNLRATRQTELAERYPIHVVCAWLGNSRAVAQEHYLQITDAHFERALRERAQGTGEQATQNATQYTPGTAGKGQELVGAGTQNRSDLPSDSDGYDSVPSTLYPRQDSNL